jgi:hypothetical protein
MFSCRTYVREGRTIIEALRDGTRISTIDEFLNVDDLAILRPKPSQIPANDVRRAIVLAFSHVGKRYDFDFDSNTWDTIVCSELAFQTYVNVRWHVGRTFGSYTIAPDDVAIAAGPAQSAGSNSSRSSTMDRSCTIPRRRSTERRRTRSCLAGDTASSRCRNTGQARGPHQAREVSASRHTIEAATISTRSMTAVPASTATLASDFSHVAQAIRRLGDAHELPAHGGSAARG